MTVKEMKEALDEYGENEEVKLAKGERTLEVHIDYDMNEGCVIIYDEEEVL